MVRDPKSLSLEMNSSIEGRLIRRLQVKIINRMRSILLVAMVLSLMMVAIPFAPISAAGNPTVTLLNPSTGAPGSVLVGVVITGTDFTGATAVNLSPAGVTASNLVVNGAGTQITATLTISGGATPGPRNVTVTAGGITSAPLAGGFTVTTTGAATVTLSAPTFVPQNGGFYIDIGIINANDLKNFELRMNFNSGVVEMAGVESSTGSSSGIISGVVNGVTIPSDGWTFQPLAGTKSGTVKIISNIPTTMGGDNSVNGNGSLARVHMKAIGGAASQTNINIYAIYLGDPVAIETYPASPAPITVTISANTAQAVTVVTDAASAVGQNTATLHGRLTGLGTASVTTVTA
jgi:hypothetical protein